MEAADNIVRFNSVTSNSTGTIEQEMTGVFNETTEFPYNYSDVATKNALQVYYPYLCAEMGLSITCLIITIVVYIRSSKTKNVAGKILLTVCGCLIVTYIGLTLDLLLRTMFSSLSCYILAIVVHISFLSMFLWTNVMAFDICLTIRALTPRNSNYSGTSQYRNYSLYAWIAVLVILTPALVLDNTALIPILYRPNFATKRCWLNEIHGFIIYFNLPVGIILSGNLIIFIRTARTLNTIKNSTSILQIKKQRKRFKLLVKLFLAMGLVWLTEFVPFITGIHKLYAVAGALNCLHGVFLFMIFVCKFKKCKRVFMRKSSHGTVLIFKTPVQSTPSFMTIIPSKSSVQTSDEISSANSVKLG